MAGGATRENAFEEKTELGIICPRCGTNSPRDTLFCPNCGQPLGAQQPGGYSPFGGQPYAQRFVTNVPPDEKIDGIPVAEVAAYVRTGTVSYLSKFFRMDREKKKIGWNWAAFFFSPFWFFYRKLYAAGAVVTSLLLALSVAFSGPLEQYMEAYLQYAQAAMQGQAAAESALAALWGAMPLATLFLGLQLVLHVVCALIANRLYFKKRRGTCTRSMSKRLGRANTGSSSLRRVERRCCSASALMCCMTSPICWSSSFWPKFYKIILGGL